MTEEQIFNIIKETLKEYSAFSSWQRCADNNNMYVNMWNRQEDGFIIARRALDLLVEYENTKFNNNTARASCRSSCKCKD